MINSFLGLLYIPGDRNKGVGGEWHSAGVAKGSQKIFSLFEK